MATLGSGAAKAAFPFEPRVCEHCQPLRHETNVIVLARLNLLHKLASVNLWLALASILYFSVCLVLLVVSVWPEEGIVDDAVYHYLDFSSTFLFSLVEVLTLLYSPERRFRSPILLRFLIFSLDIGPTYIHTYTHTYIHTYVHICAHMYIYLSLHDKSLTLPFTLPHIHTYIYMCISIYLSISI